MKGLLLFLAICLASGMAQARPVVTVSAMRPLNMECLVDAAREHTVPLAALIGILAAEGGKEGEARRNANGSWDLGPFQVNTCNLNELVAAGMGFTPEAIMLDGCVNARAAALLLRRELERSGNIWDAIGAYHSRTPQIRDAYIARVRKHLARMRHGLRLDGVKP
jgi:hypothetical protein